MNQCSYGYAEKEGVRLVSDFRADNQQVPGVMPNQEASMSKLRDAR